VVLLLVILLSGKGREVRSEIEVVVVVPIGLDGVPPALDQHAVTAKEGRRYQLPVIASLEEGGDGFLVDRAARGDEETFPIALAQDDQQVVLQADLIAVPLAEQIKTGEAKL
jgi:hypothetical protein